MVFVPDLLFGSNVIGALSSAGLGAVLVGDPQRLHGELQDAAALVVDLTADVGNRIEQVRLARPPEVPTVAFYSHVETDVRERAERAGFDVVIPRSRMAREGPAILERVLARR